MSLRLMLIGMFIYNTPLFATGGETPWTPSYLSFHSQGSLELLRGAHEGSIVQARCSVEGAPFIDWGTSVEVAASSHRTPKLFARIERQLLCDLGGDPIALTAICSADVMTTRRARNPLFFEMASKALRGGCGIGRHILNTSSYYTQLFSYLQVGLGNHGARFGTAEFGLRHVYQKRHTIHCSVEFLRTFPRSRFNHFFGIATRRISATSYALWYRYRFDSGIEIVAGVLHRSIHGGIAMQSMDAIQIGCSIPMAL